MPPVESRRAGAIAQSVERDDGIVEVRGASPRGSTNLIPFERRNVDALADMSALVPLDGVPGFAPEDDRFESCERGQFDGKPRR